MEHRYAPNAGWVTFLIRSEADVARAKEIIQLSYENAARIMSAVEAKSVANGPRN